MIGIVMGSDSDWPTMKAAAEVCAEFDVPFEADVVSAHRMPAEMIDYGRSAHERGLKVWIYTINDEATARQILALGVDGIITDNPAIIWKTLATR